MSDLAGNSNHEEDKLMREIVEALPETFWIRYRFLVARRDEETLTPGEQAELIGLTGQTEELTLRRTVALITLAERRGVALPVLMRQLDIRPMPV